MKRFITILSIFLLISLNINSINAFAQPKAYAQGVYLAKDLNLSPNMSPNVQNISPNTISTLLIFDSNQLIQQALRLKPQSPKYALLPVDYDYTIVIIGSGKISFS